MRKKIPAIIRRIRKLKEERVRILEDLLAGGPLIRGSLSFVKRSCGKEGCHCAKKPAHEAWVLMSTPKGRRRCQVVRQEDVPRIRELVETYRKFRAAIRGLKTMQTKEEALLRGILEGRAQLYE